MTYTYLKNKINPPTNGFKSLDDYLYYLGVEKAKKGNKTILKDNRTFIKKIDGREMPHIEPFINIKNQVYIVCPFCGDIHRHGDLGDHKIAHCHTKNSIGEYMIINKSKYKKNH